MLSKVPSCCQKSASTLRLWPANLLSEQFAQLLRERRQNQPLLQHKNINHKMYLVIPSFYKSFNIWRIRFLAVHQDCISSCIEISFRSLQCFIQAPPSDKSFNSCYNTKIRVWLCVWRKMEIKDQTKYLENPTALFTDLFDFCGPWICHSTHNFKKIYFGNIYTFEPNKLEWLATTTVRGWKVNFIDEAWDGWILVTLSCMFGPWCIRHP